MRTSSESEIGQGITPWENVLVDGLHIFGIYLVRPDLGIG